MIAAAAALAAPPSEALADQVALHYGRDGRRLDSAGLAVGYEAACAAGAALACNWRAWDAWGRVKGDALARLTDPVCASGDAGACVALAYAIGLGADGAWSGSGADRAAELLVAACGQGSARACRECASLDGATCAAPPAAAAVPGSCADGWVAACEVDGRAGDVAALERWCRAGASDGCLRLASARVGAPVPRQDRAPDEVVHAPEGFLLGWDGARWTDHALVRPADVERAVLEVRGSRDEWFVLALRDGGGEVPLRHGCDAVGAEVGPLAAAGVPIRTRNEDGGPAASVCMKLAGVTVPYVAGSIAVTAQDPTESARAGDLRKRLDEDSAGLFACVDRSAPTVGAVEIALQRARSGPAKKASVSASSGSPEYDACVLAWLRAVPLGETEVPGRFLARVELGW